jgi:hypothetical protein
MKNFQKKVKLDRVGAFVAIVTNAPPRSNRDFQNFWLGAISYLTNLKNKINFGTDWKGIEKMTKKFQKFDPQNFF